MEILIALALTVVSYLAYPLIRLAKNGGKFDGQTAHRIALWNSVVVGILWLLASIVLNAMLSDGSSSASTGGNLFPSLLYYWINKAILTDKHPKKETQQQPPAYGYNAPGAAPQQPYGYNTPGAAPTQQQTKFCTRCGNPMPAGTSFCTKCGNQVQ